MHTKYLPAFLLVSFVFVFFIASDSMLVAGGGTCNTTGSTSSDTGCGYLYLEELQEDDRTSPARTGIDLYLGYDATYDDVVQIGFDATEIESRTWGNGSNFTWTFDGSAGIDPTFDFADDSTTVGGTLEAYKTITSNKTSVLASSIAQYELDNSVTVTGANSALIGFKYESPVLGTSAAITNAIGMYIDEVAQTGITNAFGIYQLGALYRCQTPRYPGLF